MSLPVVLTIAGTDPTAGAGLQADCKTITALGGYAVSAITAVVAQNTQGVITFTQLDAGLLRAQLTAVSQDTAIDAIKIGMLGNAVAIEIVRDWLSGLSPKPPVVIDPVMVATSGDVLFESRALAQLKDLMRCCDVVTPNVSELAALTGNRVATTAEQALQQGHQLAQELDVAVVVKGGHLQGEVVQDFLIVPAPVPVPVSGNSNGNGSGTGTGTGKITSTVAAHSSKPRINTHRTHGTGCAYSSAIATRLAHQPGNLIGAFFEARAWLQRTIEHADTLAFGKGNGPIHHTAQIADDAAAAPAKELLPAGAAQNTLKSWWESCERIRHATDELAFVKELGAGTLPEERFSYYLQQDALYLREYSKALAAAAELAPTLVEQRFWMQGAYQSLNIERGLHDSWLAGRGLNLTDPQPSAVTDAYTRHFLKSAREHNYHELIAALLPCYWMYQDIGSRLAAKHQRADHPYRNWLASYADPKFAQSTMSARTIVARQVLTLERAGDTRAISRMHGAFLASCQYEHDFFEAPYVDESTRNLRSQVRIT